MSTLDEDVNALKAELAEYAALSLDARLIPTTAALITESRRTLNELLKAQNAAASAAASASTGAVGKHLFPYL